MTLFNTQQGKGIGYRLQFETDDKEKFLYMQECARRCVDGKLLIGRQSRHFPIEISETVVYKDDIDEVPQQKG